MILLSEKGENPKTISPKKAQKLLKNNEAFTVVKKKDTIQLYPKQEKQKKAPLQFSKVMVIVSLVIIMFAYGINAFLAYNDKAQVDMGVPLATAFGGIVSLGYCALNGMRDVASIKNKAPAYDLNKLKEAKKIAKAISNDDDN